MKKFLMILPLVVVFFLSAALAFSATAFAANAVSTPDSSLGDLVQSIYDAFAGGHYAYAAALFTIALAAAAKRYLGDSVPFLHSDAGGSLLALMTSSAAAVAAGLGAPDAVLTWGLMRSALVIGVAAAGGYTVIKNVLIEPIFAPYLKKAPPIAQKIGNWVMWIFDHSTLAATDPLSKHTPVSAGDVAVVTITTVAPTSPVAPKSVRDALGADPSPGAESAIIIATNPNPAPAGGAHRTEEN